MIHDLLWSILIVLLAFIVILLATEPRLPHDTLVPVHLHWIMPEDEDLQAEMDRQKIEIDTAARYFNGKPRDPFKEGK